MADRRVEAAEIARTVNGKTDAASHLRRIGVGMTICGIRIAAGESFGESRIWYPVAEDEAARFASCESCEAGSGGLRVVTRPKTTDRPVDAVQDMSKGIASGTTAAGNVIGLYAAVYQGIEAHLSGKAIVPHSITADVYRLSWLISFATEDPNSLTGAMSALDARKALAAIRYHAASIRYDLEPYVPEDVKREAEAVPTILQARDAEIMRLAQSISDLVNNRDHPLQLVAIQNQAAAIVRTLNGATGSDVDWSGLQTQAARIQGYAEAVADTMDRSRWAPVEDATGSKTDETASDT